MSHRRFTHRFRRALRAGIFAAAGFGVVRTAHAQPPAVPQPPSQSSQSAPGAYRPPSLALVQPARGTPVPQDKPVAMFRYSAGEANDPVDPRSFLVTVDGADRTDHFAITGTEAWGLLGPANVAVAQEELLAIGGHEVNARICSVRGACSTIVAQVTVEPGLVTSSAEHVPRERKRRARLIEILLDAARTILVRPSTTTPYPDPRMSVHRASVVPFWNNQRRPELQTTPEVTPRRAGALQRGDGEASAAQVSPKGGSMSAQAFGQRSAIFQVYNPGDFGTYLYACNATGSVTGCSVNWDGEVPIGETENVEVIFTTSGAGSGTVTLEVGGGGTDEGWYDVSVEPNLTANTQVTNNENQSMAACASDCFAATYSQGTVPYYSMDAPRNVTLAYHGDRVALRPFIHVDVSQARGAPTVQEYWLEARVNGSLVPFLNENGGTRIRFAGTNSSVRLGGQLDASGYATGVHPMDIIVTARSTGGDEVSTTSTQLLVADDRSSRIARGWSIAGLQRLHEQGDGSAVITSGDGSAAYFRVDCGLCAPATFHSPAGDFSVLRRTGSGSSMVFTRIYPDSAKALFDNLGRLAYLVDRFGNDTRFLYDANGRLEKIEDPFRTYNAGANRSYIALSYGSYGLSQIQEPGPDGSPAGGRITSFTVSSDSTLRVFKDPDGDSTVFGYDGSRRLETITDRRGGVTTYNYHASSGKLESVDLPTVALYDNTNARPRMSYSPWQTAGVPTAPTQITPATPVTTGSVTGATTDPLGRQANFTTDRWGQPLGITDPVGRTTTITRNGLFPSSIRRPTGAIDYTSFSGALLTSATPAGQTQAHIRYGGWAQPDSVHGSGRVAQRFFLGPNGRVDSVRIAGQDSLKMHFTYDTRGRVTSQRDAAGHTTYMHYDAVFGNLDSTLAPGNRFTKLTFDGYGRVQTQQSNDEPLRQVAYDSLNRVREVNDGVNALPTKYTYDKLFLTQVEDPKQQVFRFEHNALGWVTREYDPADPLNRYESFAYDSAGNVRQWTNRRGQQISYTYDALNRPLSKTGTNTTADSLWYSPDGLKMASWNAASTDSIYFSSTGWVDSVVTLLGGKKFKRAYTATSVQRLDGVTITSDAGITFAPRRFAWNSLTGALDTAFVNGQATRFTRNREMLPTQTIWPSITRTHQWTDIHRPGEQSFSDATVNTALFRRYGYDSRSQLQDRIRWDGSNFRTQQAGYDGLRRLGNQGDNLYSTTQCPWDAASGYLCPTSFQHQVTFDAGGNLTDAANSAYLTGNRIKGFGVDTFAHDLDGNLTQKHDTATNEDKRYEWSAEGRLMRVLINGTERVRYDYNPSGVLTRRWTNGVLDRHFLWDQGHLLAELNNTATERIGEYAYLPGADEPLALITGAQSIAAVRYFVQDEVGNVVALLNGTTIDQQVSYDDWGVPTLSGSADNRLLFKGLLWESNATGMYYVRARWYDPDLGRFVSEDPLGISEGTNYYSFAGNDGVNGSDPTGNSWLSAEIRRFSRRAGGYAPALLGLASMTVAGWAGGMTFGAAFLGAAEATAASALGSAAGALVETAVGGASFSTAFRRNVNNAGWGFTGASVFSGLAGGVAKGGLGSSGLFQGTIRTRKAMPGGGRGFTFGTGAWLTGDVDDVMIGGASLLAHEFGHTIQFITINSRLGLWNPWVSYLGLGAIGYVGQRSGNKYLAFWDYMASGLGEQWIP